MRLKYDENPKGMFQMWVAAKFNWSTVRVVMSANSKQTQKRKRKKEWLQKDQILERMPPAVAEANMAFLKNKNGCFQCDPQAPECEEALLWHIRAQNEDDSEDDREFEMEFQGSAKADPKNEWDKLSGASTKLFRQARL